MKFKWKKHLERQNRRKNNPETEDRMTAEDKTRSWKKRERKGGGQESPGRRAEAFQRLKRESEEENLQFGVRLNQSYGGVRRWWVQEMRFCWTFNQFKFIDETGEQKMTMISTRRTNGLRETSCRTVSKGATRDDFLNETCFQTDTWGQSLQQWPRNADIENSHKKKKWFFLSRWSLRNLWLIRLFLFELIFLRQQKRRSIREQELGVVAIWIHLFINYN